MQGYPRANNVHQVINKLEITIVHQSAPRHQVIRPKGWSPEPSARPRSPSRLGTNLESAPALVFPDDTALARVAVRHPCGLVLAVMALSGVATVRVVCVPGLIDVLGVVRVKVVRVMLGWCLSLYLLRKVVASTEAGHAWGRPYARPIVTAGSAGRRRSGVLVVTARRVLVVVPAESLIGGTRGRIVASVLGHGRPGRSV